MCSWSDLHTHRQGACVTQCQTLVPLSTSPSTPTRAISLQADFSLGTCSCGAAPQTISLQQGSCPPRVPRAQPAVGWGPSCREQLQLWEERTSPRILVLTGAAALFPPLPPQVLEQLLPRYLARIIHATRVPQTLLRHLFFHHYLSPRSQPVSPPGRSQTSR